MVEPLEVKAYECPTCGYLTKDKSDADKHITIPEDSPLPVGFVYNRGIHGAPRVITRCGEKPNYEHTYICRRTPVFGKLPPPRDISVREVKDLLKRGVYSLMTPEEFEKFKNRWESLVSEEILVGRGFSLLNTNLRAKDFVRTTSELEALVSVDC